MSYRVLSQAQVVTQGKSLLYILTHILPTFYIINRLPLSPYFLPIPYSFLNGFICLYYHQTYFTSTHIGVNKRIAIILCSANFKRRHSTDTYVIDRGVLAVWKLTSPIGH
jgi:hypothetical protein